MNPKSKQWVPLPCKEISNVFPEDGFFSYATYDKGSSGVRLILPKHENVITRTSILPSVFDISIIIDITEVGITEDNWSCVLTQGSLTFAKLEKAWKKFETCTHQLSLIDVFNVKCIFCGFRFIRILGEPYQLSNRVGLCISCGIPHYTKGYNLSCESCSGVYSLELYK